MAVAAAARGAVVQQQQRRRRRCAAVAAAAAASSDREARSFSAPVTLGRAGGSGSGGDISFSSSGGGDEAAAASGAAAGNDGALATAGEDTIAAVVTGPSSQGAVAIVRISGANAMGIAQRLFRPARRGGGNGGGDGASNNNSSSSAQQWRPKSHRVYYGTLVDAGGATIDEAMLLPMLAPRSYTREDVIELHVHGGPVCCRRALDAAIAAGARPARPGEFTLRAFLNGRLDLAQAEAVAQLVTARTAAAADSALAGLHGGVGDAVRGIRGRVLDLLVDIEARIDFEEDVGPLDADAAAAAVAGLQRDIEGALRTARAGALLRNGLQVAIVGRPNVGKSSLLNALSRTERAIVTDIAGTTRDIVEADLVIGGVPLTLLDTAGIRDAPDAVEAIGVERARAAAAGADIVLMVVDAARGWTDDDGAIFRGLWGGSAGGGVGAGGGGGARAAAVRGPALLVANKADLLVGGGGSSSSSNGNGNRNSSSSNGKEEDAEEAVKAAAAAAAAIDLPLPAKEVFSAVVPTCAVTCHGLDALESAVLKLAGAPSLAQGGVAWAVNERQAEALVRAHEALMRVSEAVAAAAPYDCWTVDLRDAALALGEVSGDDVGEEVLDAVFSRFCLGK